MTCPQGYPLVWNYWTLWPLNTTEPSLIPTILPTQFPVNMSSAVLSTLNNILTDAGKKYKISNEHAHDWDTISLLYAMSCACLSILIYFTIRISIWLSCCQGI